MNSRQYFQCVLYHQKPRFSSLGGFLSYLEPEISSFSYSKEGFEQSISALRSRKSLDLGGSAAIKRLSLQLLDEICVTYKDIDDSIFSYFGDIGESCRKSLPIFMSALARAGIEFASPKLHFVEEFPGKFRGRPLVALNIDQADEVQFGVERGIYMKIGELRPIYSVFMMAHELTHAALGQISPLDMVAPIEEGLAEIIAAFYLLPLVINPDVGRNIFIYNRVYPKRGDVLDNYLPLARAAALLVREVGWAGVFKTMSCGRQALYEVERRVFEGQCLQRDGFDQNSHDLSRTATMDSAIFVSDQQFFCSPEAYLLTQHLQPGVTVKELMAAAQLPELTVRQALEELSSQFAFVSLSDDNSVVVFTVPWSTPRSLLRFNV